MEPTLEQVITWAKQAGKIALDGFLTDHTLGFKNLTDVVTEVDHACEKLLMGVILSRFPGHSILTEETGSVKGSEDHCWYIDPLDGTINYSHRLPVYCISVAYHAHEKLLLGVVYDPARDECFSAERGKGAWLNGEPIRVSECASLQKALLSTGFPYHDAEKFEQNLRLFGHLTHTTQGVRRFGSAAIDICYVACGRIDAYWEQEINAWDIAAGVLIVEEAGGKVTDLEGKNDYFKPPFALVASAPGIQQELLETILPFN
ncbi:MAG: myo-inositol-1(or 4)-monophosphatase [Chloroflexi bacterium]|nr:MAG: myo-inositol-1(or 4)-monophosphatase [Chloroflexota bacterium]MBA4374904.1 inositol monophosphatase [Anaerolinea sp.]